MIDADTFSTQECMYSQIAKSWSLSCNGLDTVDQLQVVLPFAYIPAHRAVKLHDFTCLTLAQTLEHEECGSLPLLWQGQNFFLSTSLIASISIA